MRALKGLGLVVWMVVILLAVNIVQASENNNFAAESSQSQGNFFAVLMGSQVVPPVNTPAKGLAVFMPNNDGTQLNFIIAVDNIDNVMMSHIHMAPAGMNGPIVATLYPGPTIPGPFTGVLAQGTITAKDLMGPLAGHPLSDLLKQMRAGNTYTLVHTVQHQAGEIRGQIQPI